MELLKLRTATVAGSNPKPKVTKETSSQQNRPATTTSTSTSGTIWGKIETFLIKETLSTAISVYRFAAFTKCVPFELEPKTRKTKNDNSLRVRMFPQKWKRALWNIAAWIIFIMSAFKFISYFWQLKFQEGEFGAEMAIHTAHLVASSIFTVFMGSLYVYPEACVFMLNQHDFIFRASPDLGMGSKHWASHPFVILAVMYFSRMVILCGIVFMGMFAWRPNDSAYLYSAFPEEWTRDIGIGTGIFVLCFALELVYVTWGFTILVLFFCYWCADVFTIQEALQQLMRHQELTEREIQAYLYLQIFCNLFNDFNAKYFTPGFNFAITSASILFIFVSLTCFHSLNIFIYLCFPVLGIFSVVLILCFLPQHSKVSILSQKLLKRMKKQRVVLLSHTSAFQNHISIRTIVDLLILPSLSMSNRRDRERDTDLSVAERELYLRKRVEALRPLGIQISFFGMNSLSTTLCMMDQLCNNVLLLLSL